MKKDSLGDRMKGYENVTRNVLTRRTPVIIRLDGKAFHSFTKGMERPFDIILRRAMSKTAQFLCDNIQGCKLAYTQSDEISLLLTDYEKHETASWFNSDIRKMVSVSASMATMAFNRFYREIVEEQNFICEKTKKIYYKKIDTAMFDSRVFTLPKEEVCNYFIWRQQDATRNAIQMVGQFLFSHKELQKKSCNEIQELLFSEKGVNFDEFPISDKRGICIIKVIDETDIKNRQYWVTDLAIPIFTKDREYINKLI